MDRRNNFTMIHITAAIMVVVGHQFVLLGLTPPTLLGIDIHGLGVRILFLVSGYLVSISYSNSKSIGSYVWKRVSRLYPPLVLCLILTVVVMRTVTDVPEYYWQSALSYVIHNLEMRPKFDLAGVFANNPYPTGVNGSLWTLPIELVCYFTLIFVIEIFKLFSRIGKIISEIFMVILLVALSLLDWYKLMYLNGTMIVLWGTDWFNAVTLGIYFFIGVMFYLLDLKKICNWQVGVLAVVVYVCCPSMIKYVITPYVFGYLVMCFALADNPRFYKLFKRDICYGIYLYAFPVQQLLIYILGIRKGYNLSPYFFVFISVIVVCGLAIAQSIVIEENKLLHKKRNKGRT